MSWVLLLVSYFGFQGQRLCFQDTSHTPSSSVYILWQLLCEEKKFAKLWIQHASFDVSTKKTTTLWFPARLMSTTETWKPFKLPLKSSYRKPTKKQLWKKVIESLKIPYQLKRVQIPSQGINCYNLIFGVTLHKYLLEESINEGCSEDKKIGVMHAHSLFLSL